VRRGLRGFRSRMKQLMTQALGRVTSAVIDNLGDCVTDRCGSFVARRLLAVAAGRAVAPAQGRKPKPSELFDEQDEPAEQRQVQLQQALNPCVLLCRWLPLYGCTAL
jgi:hypothetical protein